MVVNFLYTSLAIVVCCLVLLEIVHSCLTVGQYRPITTWPSVLIVSMANVAILILIAHAYA